MASLQRIFSFKNRRKLESMVLLLFNFYFTQRQSHNGMILLIKKQIMHSNYY